MGQLHSGPMAGRTVLVTGASGGIGRATALGLARMGADLAICGRPSRSGRAQQADGDGDIGMALWLPLRGRIRRRRKPGQASTGRPSGKIQTNCHRGIGADRGAERMGHPAGLLAGAVDAVAGAGFSQSRQDTCSRGTPLLSI